MRIAHFDRKNMPFNSILCSNPNMILSILALFSFSFGLCSASDQLVTGDSFTVSSFSYPQTTLRPFDLRYIRVDLPTWFSAMSIALKSDVDLKICLENPISRYACSVPCFQDITKVEKVPQSMLPVACFRDGSPPLPDASNISLKEPAISGMNNLNGEQCFPLQKNITLRLTNEQISPGVWYIGLFNGIGPARTQSKMIIRGPTYSFSANVSVEACTNMMMMGEFCNSTVYPLLCTGPDVFDASDDVAVKPMVKNVMTCRNNFETLCVQEGVAKVYSLDVMNMVEELSITATNVSFNSAALTKGANGINLMCFVRHGAMPSATLHDYSSNLYKAPLTIQSPLIGRWYIIILPLNLKRTIGDAADSDRRICYSVESQLSECPFGKAGPNCTMASYKLQAVLGRSISPFESYYLPIGGEAASDSAKFPLEPLLSSSSNGGEPDNIWTYFTMDIPHGAAGGNIHVRLSSNVKISYEVYARFGGLPSVESWDYYYANKSRRSDPSMFFMLYDSREDKVDFYIIYAREGTWGIGLRHLDINSDSSKGQTFISLSLERCPNQCSSHGSCKFSFDASGLASYSFCSCDRDHGGFDCGIELVSHKGHIRQSIFLIASNAVAILPAFWALRQKAWAEWIIYTASGISSALYHACDVGTWCALNYNALQFMDFWLSFMAVVSTFVYLATISEAFKRAIHAAVAILTALMAVTKATRSSNIILVIVIGTLGLLIGWLIELSAKYRSLSFSLVVPSNFGQSLQAIKQWLYNLVKTLLRRFRWVFVLAGFAALAMAATSWTLETSETYWFWHSWWHITIYTSSFFFLCSKANIVDSDENQLPPSTGTYALARQNSFPRAV